MRWLVRLLFCLSLVSLAALLGNPASAEPRLALVIANSAYGSGMDPLANPVNDGRLVTATLQKLGFTVTLVTDADQKAMKRAVADFGAALESGGPTTSALFYYAGHGLQVDGQNYLVPVNADIRREADVDLEAVAAEAVLRQMEYAAPRTSIVILDACRNNPLSRGFRSATRGLARMDAPNGSYVAYSTAPGQTAADGTGKNSPFAAALVAEIVKPGQGIEEAFRNVRVNVSTATSGEQTPWDSSSLMSSFYFAGEKQVAAVAPAPTPAPPPVVAPPAASAEPSAAEMAFWDSIKNSTEPGDYAAYLAQYPDGSFAKLADSRQKDLDAKAASRTAAQVAAVTPSPAAPAPVAPAPAALAEPEFESPLADGTIVLSRKVKAELDRYLRTVDNMSTATWAYFFVSSNGRAAGAAKCQGKGGGNAGIDWPSCPRIPSSVTKLKNEARGICEKQGQGDCTMLFYGADQKSDYKTIE